MRYVSTRGFKYASLEDVILNGFAPDGGLYVPERIPVVEPDTLKSWSGLTFPELAFEVLSLFIEPSDVDPSDLRRLLDESFAAFDHPDVAPLVNAGPLVLELFHSPTMSFKDVAMGFLVSLTDFLRAAGTATATCSATTGDTGLAAAHAAIGRDRVRVGPLPDRRVHLGHPGGRMTTLGQAKACTPSASADAPTAATTSTPSSPNSSRTSPCGRGAASGASTASTGVESRARRCTTSGPISPRSDPTGSPRGSASRSRCRAGAFGDLFAGYVARRAGLPIGATHRRDKLCPRPPPPRGAAARALSLNPARREVVVLFIPGPCKGRGYRALDDLELDDVPELEHPRVAAQRELARRRRQCTLEGLAAYSVEKR